jgi:GNAT superfamily N-acetyltransferase
MENEGQSHSETLRDGSRVEVRPISKADVELERTFIEGLSPQARRFRFLATIKTPGDALLGQLTNIDSTRDAAFIALTVDAGKQREVGVARFSTASKGKAEVAVTVSDGWQHKGLGTLLMRRVIDAANQHEIRMLYSIDAADNHEMKELAAYLGFERMADPDDATQVIHTLKLN